MTTPKQLYRFLIRHHEAPWCWACGAGPGFGDKPSNWFGPWGLERSHIVRQTRTEDRRSVVILCRLCHKQQHGERILTTHRPLGWPPLMIGNLLWIKQKFDPDYFDLDFLRQHSIGALPKAIEPPECYRDEYYRRRKKQ